MRNDTVPVHTNRWVVKLERASEEPKYFCSVGSMGMEGALNVTERVNGLVQLFDSREDAEKCIKWLKKVCNLNVEEATPEELVHERTASLWLDETEWPDGMSVEQDENSKRYLLVRDDGQEFFTDDLDENIADGIVRLLHKMKRKLAPKKS